MPIVRGLALLIATLALCACGGSAEEPAIGTTETTVETAVGTTETTVDTDGPPSLGCDTMPNCFPELATEALANCDQRRLSADGRRLRDELQQLVHDGIDYSNHDETEAAITTMLAFEEACR